MKHNESSPPPAYEEAHEKQSLLYPSAPAAQDMQSLLYPSAPAAQAMQCLAADGDDDTTCIICLQADCDDAEVGDDGRELMAPCACRSYVHRHCLNMWRSNSMVPGAMTECPTCKSQYQYEHVPGADPAATEAVLQRKIYWARFKRVMLTFLAIFVGSMAVWGLDRGTPKWMNLEWNALDGKIYESLSANGEFPEWWIYCILGLVATLFVIGLAGIVSSCVSSCCSTGTRTRVGVASRRRTVHAQQQSGRQGGQSSSSSSPVLCGSYHDCCYCFCPRSHGGCGGCGDCSCPSGGGGGGDDCAALLGAVAMVALVVVVLCGVVFLFFFIVGSSGRYVNRRYQREQNEIEVELKRVKNLRPLHAAKV